MREQGRQPPASPAAQVRGEILSKVLEYCKYHTEAEGEGEGKVSKARSWQGGVAGCPVSGFAARRVGLSRPTSPRAAQPCAAGRPLSPGGVTSPSRCLP